MRTQGAKRKSVAKSSALEEKLDDIVSLLRGQTGTHHAWLADTIPTPTSSNISPIGDLLEDSRDQDLTDEELQLFREHHLPDFPLVNIPLDYTAVEAQKEKPTFALAIKAVTSKVASKQVVLGKKLREILTQKILVDGERNLPLLLSLLASIAW